MILCQGENKDTPTFDIDDLNTTQACICIQKHPCYLQALPYAYTAQYTAMARQLPL